MKLVVGLGNPGERYIRTPHNVGFMVIDTLALRLSCRMKRSLRHSAEIGAVTRGGEAWMLAKPKTFMNRSGEAVGSIVRYQKVEPADIVVVLDDADLDAGRLRVRARGSSGGHRGLESIIEALGTSDFPRVRIGIGRDRTEELVDRVLKPLSAAEWNRLQRAADAAADAVLCLLERGRDAAMNEFNGRMIEETDETTAKKQTAEKRH